ncbi:hypothetical protein Scep_020271 [Stephania cephalantha]|uniref:Uncharacterized protein n=1 Tax=Stephania cephalantha TaxID=152367 RepID=A0AAP0ICM6_9MAGN
MRLFNPISTRGASSHQRRHTGDPRPIAARHVIHADKLTHQMLDTWQGVGSKFNKLQPPPDPPRRTCNSIMASYTHNYGRFEDSYYHAVNGVANPEETLDVSSREPDIIIAQYDDDEAEKEIEVISKRSEEPQKENKEDQPLVLVKPPTLPCIFDKPYTGVEVKERSRIFYTADTFVLDDHDSTDSVVLEVSNELPILKEGVHAALPKYVDAPFVVDISKGEGIT